MKLAQALKPRATQGNMLVMRSSLGGDEDQGAELPGVERTADGVPAACPIGRSTVGTHGPSRTTRYTGSPADRQADPLRKPTFRSAGDQALLGLVPSDN
jgi:hypothetical protein